MKSQKYPKSTKVGSIFYSYHAWSYNDGSTEVELKEWHVRTIQCRRGTQTRYGHKRYNADLFNEKYVNITAKVKGITWGKRSRKNGDYGWLKSIPSCYREQFMVGEPLPYGVFTTKLQALLFAIKEQEGSIERSKKYLAEETDPVEIAEWEEELRCEEKELRALKTRLTKLRKK